MLIKYGVIQKVATSYHLQINKQVEISNTKLKLILEKKVNSNKKNRAKKLDDTL